jgi:hypothetical protein
VDTRHNPEQSATFLLLLLLFAPSTIESSNREPSNLTLQPAADPCVIIHQDLLKSQDACIVASAECWLVSPRPVFCCGRSLIVGPSAAAAALTVFIFPDRDISHILRHLQLAELWRQRPFNCHSTTNYRSQAYYSDAPLDTQQHAWQAAEAARGCE